MSKDKKRSPLPKILPPLLRSDIVPIILTILDQKDDLMTAAEIGREIIKIFHYEHLAKYDQKNIIGCVAVRLSGIYLKNNGILIRSENQPYSYGTNQNINVHTTKVLSVACIMFHYAPAHTRNAFLLSVLHQSDDDPIETIIRELEQFSKNSIELGIDVKEFVNDTIAPYPDLDLTKLFEHDKFENICFQFRERLEIDFDLCKHLCK